MSPDPMHMTLREIQEKLSEKYELEVTPVNFGNKEIKLLQIKNLEEYVIKRVETDDIPTFDNPTEEVLYHLKHLPWWAKLWEPSFVLAYFLGNQPVVPGRRMLEIGAGLGFVGVYAALCGHDVTISDVEPDALLFARANALLNGLDNLEVISIDWSLPFDGMPYDVIFGSEVVYDRNTYDMLVNFLDSALKPDGTVFLAKNRDLKTPLFFMKLVERFRFKERVVRLKGSEEVIEVALYAIQKKPDSGTASR
ncbi:class I SAM-dependent methyltransferase [Thermodesulforhabdus norvegica]|uniref:Lysine methyltransferase n=1 Tax=Thermodesulforhabdus norvegica TaxID=39841 RepID=A0A1I4QH40_9BACT|nr:methyltransferase [Thermodesulforhabdus norvegica]SFM39421.1 Lysine methyltransferase [Thermodesulforhabdus norvegica]